MVAAMLLGNAWRRSALLPSSRRALSTMSDGLLSPRLLLTSSGLVTPSLRGSFHSMLEGACGHGSDNRTIAMIVTASMASSNEDASSKRSPGELRRRRMADARKKGREIEALLGVPVECVDCARPEKAAEVERALSRAGCIWVSGGNTFFLWHHMCKSGVSDLVRSRVLSDGAVYVGQSAGAIVAGRSIETAFWKGWDDPAAAPGVDWNANGTRVRCCGA